MWLLPRFPEASAALLHLVCKLEGPDLLLHGLWSCAAFGRVGMNPQETYTSSFPRLLWVSNPTISYKTKLQNNETTEILSMPFENSVKPNFLTKLHPF